MALHNAANSRPSRTHYKFRYTQTREKATGEMCTGGTIYIMQSNNSSVSSGGNRQHTKRGYARRGKKKSGMSRRTAFMGFMKNVSSRAPEACGYTRRRE